MPVRALAPVDIVIGNKIDQRFDVVSWQFSRPWLETHLLPTVSDKTRIPVGRTAVGNLGTKPLVKVRGGDLTNHLEKTL
jgi:hypothetical protein